MSDTALTTPRLRRPALPALQLGRFAGLLLPLALLALWQAATALGWVPPNQLPSPARVWNTLAALAATGELADHVAATLWRVAAGFALGAAVAVPLGAACGLSAPLRRLLDPTVQLLRSVPSLAWVPLFILWLGIAEASKVALIALGAFLPLYLNVLAAVGQVDRKLLETARAFRLGPWRTATRVVLPAALPGVFVGLRSGLALAWMFVVAAELMGASEGLGFLMVDGQSTGRATLIIGGLLLFAVAGKLSDMALAALARRLLRWQDVVAGAWP